MSIDDDKKLLQAVQEYRPPAELHPIAVHAWNLYESNGNALPPEAVQNLRGILDPLKGDLIALGEAGLGLARFMVYVTEHLGDQPTGTKVADLMREYAKLYEPFWAAIGEALRNISGEAGAAFKAFTGEEALPKTAPAFGQAAPVGSVPLRNIAPPSRPPPTSRPPPWAKKK